MLFLKVFEGCRHSRQLQDELLNTLEAGLGADDVSLATLSDSGMVYWLADWSQGPQVLRGHARVVVTGWVLGATTRSKQPAWMYLQGSKLRGCRVYRGYTTTRLQAARIQRLQGYKLQDIASQPCAHKGPADSALSQVRFSRVFFDISSKTSGN